MSTARNEFETIARGNGGSDFSLKQDGRYAVQNIQSRWVYFKLGWDKSSEREPLTVDCIGLALDLEAQAKRVESQTVERAMLAAANGLRIIAAHGIKGNE